MDAGVDPFHGTDSAYAFFKDFLIQEHKRPDGAYVEMNTAAANLLIQLSDEYAGQGKFVKPNA